MLKLEELPRTLQALWSVVVVSLFELLIVIWCCVIFLQGWPAARILAYFPSLSEEQRSVLNEVGLTTAIPALAFITILIIAQALSGFIRSIGRYAPGHLTRNSTALLLWANSKWDIQRAWIRHPALASVNGVNILNGMLEHEIESARFATPIPATLAGTVASRKQLDLMGDRLQFTKGLFWLLVLIWMLMLVTATIQFRAIDLLVLVGVLAIIAVQASQYSEQVRRHDGLKLQSYLDEIDRRTISTVDPKPDEMRSLEVAYNDVTEAMRGVPVWSFHLRGMWQDRVPNQVASALGRYFARAFRRSSRVET